MCIYFCFLLKNKKGSTGTPAKAACGQGHFCKATEPKCASAFSAPIRPREAPGWWARPAPPLAEGPLNMRSVG